MRQVLRARPRSNWVRSVSRCLLIAALVTKIEAGDEPSSSVKLDPEFVVTASVVSGIGSPLTAITSLVSLQTAAADDAIQAAEGPSATVTKISIEPDQEFSDPPVSWSVGFSQTGHAYWAMYGEKEITLVMGTLAEPERQVKCRIPKELRYAGVEPIWSQNETTVILPTLRDSELVALFINAADGIISDTTRPLPEEARTIHRVILSADDSTLFTLYQPDDMDGVSLASFDLKTSKQGSFRIRDVNLSYADMFIPTSGENVVVLTDRCQVWNLESKSRLTDLGIRYGSNARFAEFAEGKSFALLNGEDELAIWDISEPKNPVKRSTRTLQPWMRGVHRLTVDQLGERISVAGKGHVAWSSANSELSGFLRIADHYPYAGTNICSCNRYAITGGQEIRLWNLAPFEIQRTATQIGEVDFEPWEFFSSGDDETLVIKGRKGSQHQIATVSLKENRTLIRRNLEISGYTRDGFDADTGLYYWSRRASIGQEVLAIDLTTGKTAVALSMSNFTRLFPKADDVGDLTLLTISSGRRHLIGDSESDKVHLVDESFRKIRTLPRNKWRGETKASRMGSIVNNPAAGTFIVLDHDTQKMITYDADTGSTINEFAARTSVSDPYDDMFAAADGRFVVGIHSGSHIWRVNTMTGETDQPFVPCDTKSWLTCITASRKTAMIAGAVAHEFLYVWNTNTGDLLYTFALPSGVTGGFANLALTQRGTRLCAAWRDASDREEVYKIYSWPIPQ